MTFAFEIGPPTTPGDNGELRISTAQPICQFKTDPIDADGIARFGEAAGIAPRPQQLADLVGRRRQIVDMIETKRQCEKRASVKKFIGRLVNTRMPELSSVGTNAPRDTINPQSAAAGYATALAAPAISTRITSLPARRNGRAPASERKSIRI